MADILPGKTVFLTRSQLRDLYIRDHVIRAEMFGGEIPDTREGSKVYQDATVFADAATLLLAQAVAISNGISRATATGSRLDEHGKRLSAPRNLAVGSSGAVAAPIGVSGSLIRSGDRLVDSTTTAQYSVDTTATYYSGDAIPVTAIDTGAGTNLDAGTILEWVASRPGCGPTATVIAQADGSGLSGGSPDEDDDTYRARLDDIAANPPASGNDAEYQKTGVEATLIAVQQVFTYPAILGPGTIGVAFTLRPAQPGANRIPNATMLALMNVLLSAVMPASDGIFLCTLVGSPVTVVLKVAWAQGADGWADASTWPPYLASPNLVAASANAAGVLSATAFRLSSSGLSSPTAPQVGQSIGFFDLPNRAFRRKKILAVTAISATTYDVTVDTTQGVSDTGYTPASGQPCCPWSDSLDSLIAPTLAYFDTLGPGEQVASFFDPGLRQKRSPASPQRWPSVLNNRLLGGQTQPRPAQGPQQNQAPVPTLLTTTTLADVELIEPAPPYATPVGTTGVSSNQLTLNALLAFPE